MNEVQHVRDVDGPLKKGQVYLVDHVLVTDLIHVGGRYWPVLDEHLGDISGKLHFHIDSRFLTRDDLKDLKFGVRSILAGDSTRIDGRKTMIARCYRNFGKIEFEQLPDWTVLQQQLISSKCVLDLNCMKCPHQGLNLKQVLPVEVDGKAVVICPNHHITWSLEDGSLLERKT